MQKPDPFNRVTLGSETKAVITYADAVQVPAATHFLTFATSLNR